MVCIPWRYRVLQNIFCDGVSAVISRYNLEDFRKKLLELRVPVQNRSTGAYHVFSPFKKPFHGIITENSFRLEGSSPVLDSSYFIEGNYFGEGEYTSVEFQLKRRVVYYVLIRSVCLGVYLFVQALAYTRLSLAQFAAAQIPIALVLLSPIILDIYYKQQLLYRFIQDLKIK